MVVSPDKGVSGNPLWFVKEDYRFSLYLDHGKLPIYEKFYDLESHCCGYVVIRPTHELFKEEHSGRIASILTILESEIMHFTDVELAIHCVKEQIRKGNV